MKRKNLEARRNKVIQTLRDTGMTDAEIAAELGIESLNQTPMQQNSENVGTPAKTEIEVVQTDSPPIEDDGILDVEVVDLSKDGAMHEPAVHLPAVISEQPSDSTGHAPRDWSKSSVPERRCKAHRKNGDQCKNSALIGSTVCRYHGGAAKHVKAAARARIENATDRMAKELLGMAIDADIAPAVKLAAIKDALDRGGLKAPSEVVVSAGATTGFDEVFTDVFTGTREESRRIRGYESPQPEINQSNLVDHVLGSPSPTAPVDDHGDGDQYGDYAEHVDSDRPAATQRRFEDDRRSWERPERHVIGEDALRIANDTRALPPGRSRRRQ